MSIKFNNDTKTFQINTKNSTYAFCITNLDYIEHLYYGKKVENADFRLLSNRQIYTFGSTINGQGRDFSESTMLTEISSDNSSDFREGSVSILNTDKTVGNRFTYKGHQIIEGRKELEGLPYSRADQSTKTLILELEDKEKQVLLDIHYVVFYEQDIIARHIEIKNNTQGEIRLIKAQSLNLDIASYNFDLIEITGFYSFEFSLPQRKSLKRGIQGIQSNTNSTSHHANPLFFLCERNANEDMGEVYGFNLIYSGGFSNQIEVDRLGNTRIITGVNKTSFNYKLAKGEIFVSPEAIMTYTDMGIGQASRNFHDHIREHIIPTRFVYSKRPIVVNSWEGSGMNVSEKDVLKLAQGAKEVGADTVVLDDGWFRSSIEEGLADYVLDEKKFPNGLMGLSDKIHDEGLKFGIWLEPECTSRNSQFLVENKDKVLRTREFPAYSREQLVLDLTSDENVNYIYKIIVKAIKGVRIDYIKWDYNRYIHEAGSKNCDYGELNYRQTLGVYKLLSKLQADFPDMMIESCAGGGGRFDLGMLYYSPQIWLSDNTNPYERAYIQYGASYGYPTSTLSCHMTKGEGASQRESSYNFRYLVASMGVYGYELNLEKLSKSEKAELKKYTDNYLANLEFCLSCDFYRLIDIFNDRFSAYIQVTKDKTKALFTFLQINAKAHQENVLVKLKGLAPDKLYLERESGKIYSGSVLMYGGIRLPDLFKIGAGGGYQLLFTQVT